MNNLLPFEPPYQPISAEFEKSLLEHAETAGAAPARASAKPVKNAKAPGPATSPKANVFFLVVPFAEKEDAKALGARWDAASKKWYVPSDKELTLFTRWMPKQ